MPKPMPKNDDTGKVVTKSEKDVLLGRGKRISEWPGNILFRLIVNKYRYEYNVSRRLDKVHVAEQVIQEVHDSGGRFIKEVENSSSASTSSNHNNNNDDNNNSNVGTGIWIEVDRDRAIEKTCQCLREKEKTPSIYYNSPQQYRDNMSKHYYDKYYYHNDNNNDPRSPRLSPRKRMRSGSSASATTANTITSPATKGGGVSSPQHQSQSLATKKRKTETTSGTKQPTKITPTKTKSTTTAKNVKPVMVNKEGLLDDEATRRPTYDGDAVQKSKSPTGAAASKADAEKTLESSSKMTTTHVNTIADHDAGAARTESSILSQIVRLKNSRSASINKCMFQKLCRFKDVYGSCAVPPGWIDINDDLTDDDDIDNSLDHNDTNTTQFADWCSIQRQVYRQVMVCRYREPTPEEREMFTKLEEVGFVWDYAPWHWEDRYSKLQQYMDRSRCCPGVGIRQQKQQTTVKDDEQRVDENICDSSANGDSIVTKKRNTQNQEDITIEDYYTPGDIVEWL